MSRYTERMKFILQKVGPVRISWMKDPEGRTFATVTGSNSGDSGYLTDLTGEAVRALHHLVKLAEARERVTKAREELSAAEQALTEAFNDLDDDRSGA